MENSFDGIIEFSQVTSTSGQFPVLSRFTLSVHEGQFIGLFGPTGCGKSTVLRIAGGLMRPSSGTVTVAGEDLTRMSDSALRRFRRNIGFYTRRLLASGSDTVLDAVLPPAILAGFSYGDAHRLADEALAICGLSPIADAPVHAISAGQQQLTCLAQALIHKPPIILADEPAAHLDSEHAEKVIGVLSAYASNGGTVLAVSNEPLPVPYATPIDMEKLHHV